MLVAWLEDAACQAVSLTGGKAASLSRLAAEYPVPAGFCLTSQAYRRWADTADPTTMPEEVLASLADAYRELPRGESGATCPVAVRSSAIGEDGQSASFAGQYATYLNVSDLELVARAVIDCWLSARSDQVQAYQQHRSQPQQPVGVLVQQMIPADVAFVAFSAHPVTGDRDDVVINASWGLGESIVNGASVPDSYLVRKGEWTVTEAVIGEKERMTVMCQEGVREVSVPRVLRGRNSLTPSQAVAIARLATQLETQLDSPVDIEGAYESETIYLLQCRPITTLRRSGTR